MAKKRYSSGVAGAVTLIGIAAVLWTTLRSTDITDVQVELVGNQPGFAVEIESVSRFSSSKVLFDPGAADPCTFSAPNYEAIRKAVMDARQAKVRCVKRARRLRAVEITVDGMRVLDMRDVSAYLRRENSIACAGILACITIAGFLIWRTLAARRASRG